MTEKVMPKVPIDKEMPCLTVREVAALCGMGVRTVWRRVQDGLFPPPHSLGGRLRRWAYADINEFLRRAGGVA